MFRELRLIGGIGAKTAHNIRWRYTRNALENQIMTFVTSVVEKKESKIVQLKGLNGFVTSLLEYVWYIVKENGIKKGFYSLLK